VDSTQAKAMAPTRIQDVWTVVSKSCDGVSMVPAPYESYRFDSVHFVHVLESSRTDDSLCVSAFAYNRAVSTFSGDSRSYREVSTLSSTLEKRECWRLRDGEPSGKPIAEQPEKFGPETLSAEMTSTHDTIVLELARSSDCPTGTLRLVLDKVQ
jgi:hypothetical protein